MIDTLTEKIVEQRDIINKERELILQQKERIEGLVQDLADSNGRVACLQKQVDSFQKALTTLYRNHS